MPEANGDEYKFVPNDQSDNLEADLEHEYDNDSSEDMGFTDKQWNAERSA